MCDLFLQNYSQAINNVASSTQDLEPTIMVFTGIQCTNEFGPQSEITGSYLNFDYPVNQEVTVTTLLPGAAATPQAIFIPFLFEDVLLTSTNRQYTTTIKGPWTASNLALVNWQTKPDSVTNFPSMVEQPLGFITVLNRREWDAAVTTMCMGRTQTLGPFSLTRFSPQSERCDTFMTTYCEDNNEVEACGCFRDLTTVTQQSLELGVDLPVLCFGESCATQKTYKTAGMLAKPCNITLCRQRIQQSEGAIINEATATVFCGGQFYNATGDFVTPPSEVVDVVTNVDDPDATSFIVWIILGVSGLLFALLIYLIFSPSPQPASRQSIIEQVKNLPSSNFTPSPPT